MANKQETMKLSGIDQNYENVKSVSTDALMDLSDDLCTILIEATGEGTRRFKIEFNIDKFAILVTLLDREIAHRKGLL